MYHQVFVRPLRLGGVNLRFKLLDVKTTLEGMSSATIVRQCAFCLSCIGLGFLLNLVLFRTELRDMEDAPPGQIERERLRQMNLQVVKTKTNFGDEMEVPIALNNNNVSISKSGKAFAKDKDKDVLCKTRNRDPVFVVGHPKGAGSQLRHLRSILKEVGMHESEKSPKSMKGKRFKLLWLYKRPEHHEEYVSNLREDQFFNHLPGFPNKILPLIAGMPNVPNVPKTFVLPREKQNLLAFAHKNRGMLFVSRSENRRHIEITRTMNLTNNNEHLVVQEYVDKPFLIDGYRFDIGVYVVVTSVNPLRAYAYDGDVSLRFCSTKYRPFSPKNSETFVVESHPRDAPTSQMANFSRYHRDLGYNSKATLDMLIKDAGGEPANVWDTVDEVIRSILVNLEMGIARVVAPLKPNGTVFELVRFDFNLNTDFKPWLMEINKSPFLGEKSMERFRSLHRQVLTSTLSLVGLLNPAPALAFARFDRQVFPKRCLVRCFKESKEAQRRVCAKELTCSLCRVCMRADTAKTTRAATLEFHSRMGMRRISPEPIYEQHSAKDMVKKLTPAMTGTLPNYRMHLWYLGKCLLDEDWC